MSSRLSIHQFPIRTHPRASGCAALTLGNAGDYATSVGDRDPREPEPGYRLAAIGRAEAEDERLGLLERIFDPGSRRRRALVQPGWRCLEIGAGRGSMAVWVAGQVGERGQVVATDIDVTYLKRLEVPNLEVRRHDILEDPLDVFGPGSFVGLLLAGRYATGPDLWELVRITCWTPAMQTATVNRNLTNTWPIGSLYRCWYDIRGADQLHVLPEFSADTTAMTVTPIFVDSSGKIRTWALDLVLTNSAVTGTAGEIQETGYRHGLVRSTAVKGLLGAKLRVKSTANGSVSLWLARS